MPSRSSVVMGRDAGRHLLRHTDARRGRPEAEGGGAPGRHGRSGHPLGRAAADGGPLRSTDPAVGLAPARSASAHLRPGRDAGAGGVRKPLGQRGRPLPDRGPSDRGRPERVRFHPRLGGHVSLFAERHADVARGRQSSLRSRALGWPAQSPRSRIRSGGGGPALRARHTIDRARGDEGQLPRERADERHRALRRPRGPGRHALPPATSPGARRTHRRLWSPRPA